MNTNRRALAAVSGLLAAGAVALAGSAQAAPACEGGVTGPQKRLVHALEGPVSGTPAETVVHAVECSLP